MWPPAKQIMKNDISDKNIELQEESSNNSIEDSSKNIEKSSKKHLTKEQIRHRKAFWYSIRITILALALGILFSFISEILAQSHLLISSIILLILLIIISIFFDGIGIAATSCDLAPLTSMASRKVYGAKTAIKLVKNNSKVSSICSDLIGDTFGIVSGACATVIAIRIITLYALEQNTAALGITIAITSVVTALTIGGKSFVKNFAISKSQDFIMFVSKLIAIFSKNERAILKKKRNHNNEK